MGGGSPERSPTTHTAATNDKRVADWRARLEHSRAQGRILSKTGLIFLPNGLKTFKTHFPEMYMKEAIEGKLRSGVDLSKLNFSTGSLLPLLLEQGIHQGRLSPCKSQPLSSEPGTASDYTS